MRKRELVVPWSMEPMNWLRNSGSFFCCMALVSLPSGLSSRGGVGGREMMDMDGLVSELREVCVLSGAPDVVDVRQSAVVTYLAGCRRRSGE